MSAGRRTKTAVLGIVFVAVCFVFPSAWRSEHEEPVAAIDDVHAAQDDEKTHHPVVAKSAPSEGEVDPQSDAVDTVDQFDVAAHLNPSDLELDAARGTLPQDTRRVMEQFVEFERQRAGWGNRIEAGACGDVARCPPAASPAECLAVGAPPKPWTNRGSFDKDLAEFVGFNLREEPLVRDRFGSSTVPAGFSPGCVPWVRQFPPRSLLPETEYAQWYLARRMSPDAHVARGTCDSPAVRFMVQGFTNYGLGAELEILALGLLQAVQLNRIFLAPTLREKLVPTTVWRFAQGPCAPHGWRCVFVDPSPCDTDRVLDSTRTLKNETSLMRLGHADSPLVAARTIVKKYWGGKHFGFLTYVPLHPPWTTREAIEAAAGMPYQRWAQIQAVRYLARYVQPWIAEIVEASFTAARFPWRAPRPAAGRTDTRGTPTQPKDFGDSRPVLAMHFRNGDKKKGVEFFQQFRCSVPNSALQLAYADALDAVGPPHRGRYRYFVSFDHPRALAWVKQLERRKGANRSAVLHAGFDWGKKSLSTEIDSRRAMTVFLGRGTVLKVSLVNLILAASADAWVNNDGSTWSRIVNALRLTGGGFHCPYVDVLAAHSFVANNSGGAAPTGPRIGVFAGANVTKFFCDDDFLPPEPTKLSEKQKRRLARAALQKQH